jgi:hypothetical protein
VSVLTATEDSDHYVSVPTAAEDSDHYVSVPTAAEDSDHYVSVAATTKGTQTLNMAVIFLKISIVSYLKQYL